MERRKLLRKAAGVTIIGLAAGCAGQDGGDGGGEATPTEAGMEETPTEGETETTTEGTPSDELDLGEEIGETPQGIEVTSTNLTRVDEGDAGARLTGTIKNTGDKTYEELEVQATLFDESDDVLGEFFDNTEETEAENVVPFEPGDQWEFSIDFPRADLGEAVRYRIDVDAEIDDSVFDVGTETATPGS